MTRSGLDNYEEIARMFRRAAPELQAQAARVAAEWAIARTGLSHPAIESALKGGRSAWAESLVDELVERHFDLYQAHEEGLATADEVKAAFDLVQAANAARCVSSGELELAINDAICSAEDWSELRGLLGVLLEQA